ncbi:hypothetical protein B0A48_07026 [Cryoendolithus antarcticus]|uniref:Alpha-taxilin n=1 Tax=Cryoendolithus antarcticus TaxID=1507870 RepID=A0A1V8T7M2_9PEZI|nr:hypothetical protein B0A48_07026 [Cryoendolithus antarcticus]
MTDEMAAVANHNQQPLSSPGDYTRDASPIDGALAVPPPPPTNQPAPAKGKAAKGKKGAAASNDPNDAHKALLSKISQLEATSTETAKEEGEIDAEVKKANRDLSQLLGTMEPHHSKIDIVQRKYTELLSDMKKLERDHGKAKKRGDQLQKEKDEVNKNLTKEKAMKDKLEKLSRELTRENKKLKEDLRDEKESGSHRNDELQRKLEDLVLDVESVVSDRRAPERQTAELEQDKLFREKFTSFLHQYELRELHFQSLLRTKDLEIAYQMSRHDQLKKAQESELSKSHQLTRQVSTFSQTENELRGQLNVYVEKFKQVEDTLNNSNDLFLTFRKEMEEMSKKTKRLEKENLNLTRKQEATNKNIFQMAEERSQSQQSIDRLSRENEKLKKLCRAMQSGGYGTADRVAGQDPGYDAVEGGAVYDSGESEYEDDEEYDEDEEGEEYDDDTEEESPEQHPGPEGKAFGPPPPPPPQQQQQAQNGVPNGAGPSRQGAPAAAPQVNGRH